MPDSCCFDECRIDDERFAAAVLRFEADVLQQLLHHRLEAPRADILDRFVHLGRDAGERLDAVVGEIDRSRPRCRAAPDIAAVRLARVADRMRTKSSCVSAFSSTRIGKRP